MRQFLRFKPANLLKLPQPLQNSAFRPILWGVLGFMVVNILLSIAVTVSPFNQRLNFAYGNFLPAKLETLRHHHPEKLDVLFLGTSQTNNGFIPSQFEQAATLPINSFNLGLPNNRYDIMQAYLRYHQRQFGKPRLVLIELSPSIQERDTSLYYLPALYYRTLIEREPTLATRYLENPLLAENVKQELFWSGLSSLHQYRFTFSPVNVVKKISGKLNRISRFQEACADTVDRPCQSKQDRGNPGNSDSSIYPAQFSSKLAAPETTEKGWYPKTQSLQMKTDQGVLASVTEARKYYIDAQNTVNFDKLRALLSYCRQEQIPVTLVTWPNHPEFLKVFRQSALNQPYETGLSKLLAEEQVPWINLNVENSGGRDGRIDSDIFADPRHLTPKGARRFSRALAKSLFSLPEIQKVFSAENS